MIQFELRKFEYECFRFFNNLFNTIGTGAVIGGSYLMGTWRVGGLSPPKTTLL